MECASLYVRKLGAAGYTQILLVVVKISVVLKSVASEAKYLTSSTRPPLNMFFGLLYPLLFELSALIPDPAFSQGL